MELVLVNNFRLFVSFFVFKSYSQVVLAANENNVETVMIRWVKVRVRLKTTNSTILNNFDSFRTTLFFSKAVSKFGS